jgi:hypothetical protein
MDKLIRDGVKCISCCCIADCGKIFVFLIMKTLASNKPSILLRSTENVLCRVRSTHGKVVKCLQNVSVKYEGNRPRARLDIRRRIILKGILKEQVVGM